MFTLNPMPAKQFDLFRTLIGFGIFIILFFVFLNYEGSFIPVLWMKWVVLCGMLAALSFGLNFHRKFSSLIIIVAVISINYFNPFAIRVVHGYICWILFSMLFIPNGEGAFIRKKQSLSDWKMPMPVQLSMTLVLAFSISYSGLSKLMSPLWWSGEAIDRFMLNPRFNWELTPYLGIIPYFGKFTTYVVAISETLFFPFYMFRPTRYIAWFSIMILVWGFFTLMHIYLVAMMMIIILFFLYPWRQRL